MKTSKTFPLLAKLVLATLLLGVVSIVAAQSGRRTSKTTLPPAPPGGTAKESAPLPSPAPPKPTTTVTLEVGIDRFDAFSRIPLTNYNGVFESFVNRLKRAPSVRLVDSGMNMSRGDAVRKARGTKEMDVVWLQLGLDRIGADRDMHPDVRDVFIEYIVYAPTTAKIIAQGRTYPQAHRNKLGVPTTRTGTLAGDYLYNQAAQEAAERVLSALDLPTRPLPRH